MTKTSLLVTWFGTLLHVDAGSGALRHGPITSSPRNLVSETTTPGHSRLVALGSAAWPAPRRAPRVTHDLELHTVSIMRGPGGSRTHARLRALPGGSTDQEGAALDSWAGLLPLGKAQLKLVATVLASGWHVPGRDCMVPQRQVTMADGFVLRVGPIALDLAGAVFPIRAPGPAAGRLPHRLELIQDGQCPQPIERFTPLVCLALPRGACTKAMRVTIRSLETTGRYDGHYLLITEAANRPGPDDVDPKRVHYRHDPRLSERGGIEAKLERRVTRQFQPVLHLAIGNIVDGPVETMLHDLMRAGDGPRADRAGLPLPDPANGRSSLGTVR